MDFASIMTPDPFTVAPDDTCAAAARLLDEHHVRHLPVVEGQRAVGVVSDRELLSAEGTARVRSVMRTPVVAVLPHDDTTRIAAEIALREYGCLLVADGERLVGIVSEYDLVGAFVAAARAGRLSGADDPPVERRMSAPFESLELGATLGEAATSQLELRVRHLPVLEGARLVGMLSDRDLRRAFGKGAKMHDRIDAFVSRPAQTVEPRAALSEAAARMREAKIGALVVTHDARLLGLLTLSDLLDHCARELHFRAL